MLFLVDCLVGVTYVRFLFASFELLITRGLNCLGIATGSPGSYGFCCIYVCVLLILASVSFVICWILCVC